MNIQLTLHPETQILVDALSKVPLGQMITYKNLSELIGIDVTGPARQRLVSARRVALRDYGAAFGTERATGLIRLHPDQAPGLGASARLKIRRASSRARKAMISVAEHSNGLSPEASRRMSAEMSAHGLIAEITKEKTIKAAMGRSEKIAPPAKMAETFLNHIRGKSPR